MTQNQAPTQAQLSGEFWQAMNFIVQKSREAWSIGSQAMLTDAEKERTRRLLDVVIAQAEYAKDLMSE